MHPHGQEPSHALAMNSALHSNHVAHHIQEVSLWEGSLKCRQDSDCAAPSQTEGPPCACHENSASCQPPGVPCALPSLQGENRRPPGICDASPFPPLPPPACIPLTVKIHERILLSVTQEMAVLLQEHLFLIDLCILGASVLRAISQGGSSRPLKFVMLLPFLIFLHLHVMPAFLGWMQVSVMSAI